MITCLRLCKSTARKERLCLEHHDEVDELLSCNASALNPPPLQKFSPCLPFENERHDGAQRSVILINKYY